jgi:hypothetical protein
MLQQIVDFLGAQPVWMRIALGAILMSGFGWFTLAVGYFQESRRAVVGAPAEIGAQGALVDRTPSGAHQQPARTDAPSRSASAEAKPVKVASGDLLVLRGPQGIAVVEITHLPNSKATYRWRYAAAPRGPETSGAGELFEQYATVSLDSSGRHVTDVGGALFIVAGPYKIEWSWSGATQSYVYPRKSGIEALIVTGTSFGDFRL